MVVTQHLCFLIEPLSQMLPVDEPRIRPHDSLTLSIDTTVRSINMAATGNDVANHYGDIDETKVPGTVQLIDIDEHLATQHARGHKDIILVPTPSADPKDPLNWSPGRKRLALTCTML